MSVLCSWVVNLVVTFVHGLCGYFYFLLLFADRFVCFFLHLCLFVCVCMCCACMVICACVFMLDCVH